MIPEIGSTWALTGVAALGAGVLNAIAGWRDCLASSAVDDGLGHTERLAGRAAGAAPSRGVGASLGHRSRVVMSGVFFSRL